MNEDQADVILNAVIRADQKAMLIQKAQDDDRSVSGTLRFILDEWVGLKQLAIQTAPVEAEAVSA